VDDRELPDDSSGDMEKDEPEKFSDNIGKEENENELDEERIPLSSFKASNSLRKGFLRLHRLCIRNPHVQRGYPRDDDKVRQFWEYFEIGREAFAPWCMFN
jgi:hypothetical protein